MAITFQTWQQADGDNTLALDWPIHDDSVVWEIGGYEGRWAAQIHEKFDPNLFVFEPQEWAYEKLIARFKDTKVQVFPFGLWTHDTRLPLYEHDTDGASIVRRDGRVVRDCNFVDIHKMLATEVDLCLMNIEGGEFVLIPYLIGMDLMRAFRFFWCQFHYDFVAKPTEKVRLIYEGMAKTHKLMWDYYPTAVAWERK